MSVTLETISRHLTPAEASRILTMLVVWGQDDENRALMIEA